jgi:pimeloyl-ACP methyl ester carboxylesterase
MRRRTLITTLALSLTLVALAAAGTGAASAALSYSPCPENAGFSCAAISVPLDRSGKAPGTIALTIERKAVGATQTPSAVIALAGGPGQAADPLAAQLATAIAPALSTHDLLVFDQRGTGRSSPLNCPVFDNTAALESAGEAALGSLVELCALQIGAARGAFTTQESVEDIEAIRHQAGYKNLVL